MTVAVESEADNPLSSDTASAAEVFAVAFQDDATEVLAPSATEVLGVPGAFVIHGALSKVGIKHLSL